MRFIPLLFLIVVFQNSMAQDRVTDSVHHRTRFEISNGTQTPTYQEAIAWWKKMDASSPYVKMSEMGPSDAGFPLHLVLVSWDKDFNITSLKKKNKAILLIINGIHPGEPDGIDASMLLVKEITRQEHHLPENVVLAIVPVYNIGGALNRSRHYRVDQNGPEEFGFRGNSQNLDLNRDFIKNDSKEAQSLAKIFHLLDPDVFIDNHVSNGADYQHVMTLLTSQHNKLGGRMGEFLNQKFEPALYQYMKNRNYDLVPYVNHFGDTPETGWSEFWDSPRYSSGYASLRNTFAFVPETHMLKPYAQRVDATRELMKAFISFAASNAGEIIALRAQAKKEQQAARDFPIAWKIDRSQSTPITFKGYVSSRKPSEVSGLPRLFYDRNQPFEKQVPFYNYYRDTLRITRPAAYIIPQGWWKVIERLQANGVQMRRLSRDSSIRVEAYRIESYNASPRKFEGHHLNSNVRVSKQLMDKTFRKGDYIILMNQPLNRFLIETLEPQGEDSYFAWNFFDPILAQKEGFSDYVFEETAAQYLKDHPELRSKLEARKGSDSAFAKSAAAQLNFVYQNSPWYEPVHNQYPVYRVPR